MLHLAVNKEFTYLNYLAVASAVRFGGGLSIWIKEEPVDNFYWNLIKKLPQPIFKEIDPVTGITLDQADFTGRLDILYIGTLHKGMVDEAMIDHKDMYNDDGEFEIKGMCLVRIYKPELITREYVETSKSAIAQLIRKVIVKRVWNVRE